MKLIYRQRVNAPPSWFCVTFGVEWKWVVCATSNFVLVVSVCLSFLFSLQSPVTIGKIKEIWNARGGKGKWGDLVLYYLRGYTFRDQRWKQVLPGGCKKKIVRLDSVYANHIGKQIIHKDILVCFSCPVEEFFLFSLFASHVNWQLIFDNKSAYAGNLQEKWEKRYLLMICL